jgi:sporulation protein YlmC with PRC-barrel domain
MTDSFRQATGRKVVSRASAEELGRVSQLILDAGERRVSALVVGSGRKARLVDWDDLSGFGPDAVMVADDAAVREPAGDWDRLAADGKLAVVGIRALSERGNELGRVDDVTFDPATGVVEALVVGDRPVPATELLGSGSYAVVFDAGQDDATG